MEQPLIVKLSVRGLVEFVLCAGSIDSRYTGGANRMAEGSHIHRLLQKTAGENYNAEVSMSADRTVDGILYQLDGRADGVIDEEDGVVIDEIKTTTTPIERLTADYSPVHWAQAKCYAAFLSAKESLDFITVQLTYYQVDTEEIVRHRQKFSACELEEFLTHTLHLYTRWARLNEAWQKQRNASLLQLTFPFAQYREGQYRLAGAVYRTISHGGRLFANAPTGIGKTISTLFPALKAMGGGLCERIFYLTAKTITRQAAENALSRLRNSCGGTLRLKSLTLTAKDKICLLEQRECTPDACPYANGYYDRVNDLLYAFLLENDEFTRDTITAYAKKKLLCPFEFALDLTLFCDVVIGDYNYLFDPVVHLKRFFGDKCPKNGVFLIDEAHNLVDRARDMYSARLTKSAFFAAKKAVGKSPRKLAAVLTKINSFFNEQRALCADENVRERLLPKGLAGFNKLLPKFCTEATDYLDEHRAGDAHDAMLQLFFDAQFYLKLIELYDEHFTTLVSCFGHEVRIEILCLDAAPFLDASMSRGAASVLFSATLAPVDYFIHTLGGGEEAKHVQLQSPFPPQHLCLLSAEHVSTKYTDRPHTLPQVCGLISAAVHAKCGNYIVYCPSYQYMRQIADAFALQEPALAIAVQESGMDEKAREDFLARFSAQNSETLIGFCVLGGIFAEGIDLTGERLIGSIIVGVGLPQIGCVQNALRDYYDVSEGDGFAFAYQYPGMSKVLQAAGRVIRTEQDKGVVLLIDSRYARRDYRRLFPTHWHHCRVVHSEAETTSALSQFWSTT